MMGTSKYQRVYRDGIELGPLVLSANWFAGQNSAIKIGAFGNTQGYWKGDLDDVIVWRMRLADAVIIAHAAGDYSTYARTTANACALWSGTQQRKNM